ncbi:MAG: M17 family peptidase N-terminal domain-containing protein, partial [Candidatus Kapaibacterium sp.]
MKLSVQRFKPEGYSADATVVFVSQEDIRGKAENVRALWPAAAAILDSNDFTGAKDSTTVVYTGGKKSSRLILVGLGASASITLELVRRAAAAAAQKATALQCESIAILLPSFPLDATEVAQTLVEGSVLGVYSFDKYFTEKKAKKQLSKITFLADENGDLNAAKKGMAMGEAIANGVTLARDLMNAPSNELTPEALANQAKGLDAVGVKVTVLNKAQIEKLKMGGLLAVNQGSVRPPFFIVM